MNIPTFTAEASIYKSNGRYKTSGTVWAAKPVVQAAAYNPPYEPNIGYLCPPAVFRCV